MASKRRDYDRAPPPGDTAGWRVIAATDMWSRLRAADILRAWDSFVGVDDALEQRMRRELLKCFRSRLSKWLGNRRYGPKSTLWRTREDDFTLALFRPQSDEGRAIRAGFVNFADWGTIEAIREDLKHQHETLDDQTSGIDYRNDLDDKLAIRMARERFCKDDERRMVCLLMQDMGCNQAEIRQRTGAARETQNAWRAGFQAYLAQLEIGQP